MTLDSNFAVKETAVPEAVTQETALKENGALADEAMAALSAPRKLEPEQLTGITNVASNFGEGVVSELIHNPGTLVLNAAGSFGIGYLANKGLQSAAMRVPTIGLMAAAGGYGLYQLGKALPGWKQSYDVASDPSAHDAASVLQAEKHIQSIGGGTLEFAVGGVAGGLAFKPGVSAAAESLLARTRATIFGEKPHVKQYGPDGKEIFLADEINGIGGAKAAQASSGDASSGDAFGLPPAVYEKFNFGEGLSKAVADEAMVAKSLAYGEAAQKFKFGSGDWTNRNQALMAMAEQQGNKFTTNPEGAFLLRDEAGNVMVKSTPDGREFFGYRDGELNQYLSVSPNGSQTYATVDKGVFDFQLPGGVSSTWKGALDPKTGEWHAAAGEVATPELAAWKGFWDTGFSKVESYFPGLSNSRLYARLKGSILPEEKFGKQIAADPDVAAQRHIEGHLAQEQAAVAESPAPQLRVLNADGSDAKLIATPEGEIAPVVVADDAAARRKPQAFRLDSKGQPEEGFALIYGDDADKGLHS